MFWRKPPPSSPPDHERDAGVREIRDEMRAGIVEAQSRQWYRDQYRRMVLVSLGAVAVSLAALAIMAVQLAHRPRPAYIAVTPDFRVRELPTLEEPVVSDAALLNWVTQTVTETLTLDFKDWRPKLIQLQSAYDPAGFEQLVRTLISPTGFVTLLEKERLVSAAVVQSPPLIRAAGMFDGVYSWKIEFPLDLGFESSKGHVNTQRLLAQVVVSRADTLRVPQGVVIHQLVLKPR